MSEVWVPIVGSISLFGMIGFIVFVTARTKQRIEQGRSELQARILDKFGSGPEFAAFAQTPEGRRLLHGTSSRSASHDRLLGWLRTGLVTSFLGIGFLLTSVFRLLGDDQTGLVIGTLLLSLGVGFLASAFLSRRLTRTWATQELEQQAG